MVNGKRKIVTKPENIEDIEVGGKTIRRWNKLWEPLEGGFGILHSELNKSVGLFRASIGEHVFAIGKGVEFNNGGLRKRLSDFRRKSHSARDHKLGIFIALNLDWLDGEILITGSDYEARQTAEVLRTIMIDYHKPSENVPQVIIEELLKNKN